MSEATLVPGVGSSYGHGWRTVWKYFLELLLIAILGWLIGVPGGAGGWASNAASGAGFLSFLAFIYSILIMGPVEYGISYAYLKASRDEKVEVKDMFEAFNNYWNAVLANILVVAIVAIGLFLLIVPGIIFACKLAFTPFLIVDRKMEVMEAIKESWRMTNGYAWTIFFIGLVGVFIALAGLIVFLVGVIISAMWIMLALASLYHAVSSREAPPSQASA